jgi:DNA-binding CsgD family transcriptional regulator
LPYKRLDKSIEQSIVRLYLEGETTYKKIAAELGISHMSVANVVRSNNLNNSLDKVDVYQEAVHLYLQGRTRRQIRIATGLPPTLHRLIERKYAEEKKRRMVTSGSNKTHRTNQTAEDRSRLCDRIRTAFTSNKTQDGTDS